MPGPSDNPGRKEGVDDSAHFASLKQRRKNTRSKITRSKNRIQSAITAGDDPRRLKREITDLRKDFDFIREIHSEMYEYAEESQTDQMDEWESDLTREFYGLEQEIEDYVALQQANGERQSDPVLVPPPSDTPPASVSSQRSDNSDSLNGDSSSNSASSETSVSTVSNVQNSGPTSSRSATPVSRVSASMVQSSRTSLAFDSWIDDLQEFTETSLTSSSREITVAEALYKLEASKDIPQVQIVKFDGDPLNYIEFIERFKIQIHNKSHLTDDIRMMQLKMHLSGNAERAVMGLGSQRIMYATALKTIKEHYGQPSAIARAYTNRLVHGNKMSLHDKSALREFSLDIINAIAALKQMNYYADINATDNLRQIIKRLPDSLVERWKSRVIEIRSRDEIPYISHVSTFVRKYVKAQFDPDFGDLDEGRQDKRQNANKDGKRTVAGVYAAQQSGRPFVRKCYVCDLEHRVAECPTFKDSSVDERYTRARELRLCFSCLKKGHGTRDCRTKRKCGTYECSREHHPLLHNSQFSATRDVAEDNGQPGAQRVTTESAGQSSEQTAPKSVYTMVEKDVLLPVVRVTFRSANGRVREGNVLIDSGAGVTIVRKDFSKSLGLQGKEQRLDLALVGGETIKGASSRKVDCWISALKVGEEYCIQAYEVEQTALSAPPLDHQWIRTFPHLQDLTFSLKGGPIDVILGVQYTHLHADVARRQGRPFERIAKCTQLGWYLMGPSKQETSVIHPVNVVQPVDLQTVYDQESVSVRSPKTVCRVPDKLQWPVGNQESCERADQDRATISNAVDKEAAGAVGSTTTTSTEVGLLTAKEEWPEGRRERQPPEDSEYLKPLLAVQVCQSCPEPEEFSSWSEADHRVQEARSRKARQTLARDEEKCHGQDLKRNFKMHTETCVYKQSTKRPCQPLEDEDHDTRVLPRGFG